jgi:archaellum component FlaC
VKDTKEGKKMLEDINSLEKEIKDLEKKVGPATEVAKSVA